MADYLLYVVILDCMVIICMVNLIFQNKLLEVGQRRGFIISFLLIAFLSIVELVAAYVDKKEGLRWANIGLNYLFFALAPIVPLLFGNTLSTFKSMESKIALGIYIAYNIFIIASMPFGFVFGATEDNVYFRGPGFYIFAVLYELSKLYMVYCSYVMVKKFQNRNWFTIILLLLFFIVGSSIQIFRPDIHTSWSCITLISIVYYLYFNELSGQLDGMTGLFSHQAYLARAQNLRPGESILIMDCDKFKELNDNYGHMEGDRCLIAIARVIKDTYSRDGICYRIGGDEFAVILFKEADRIELYSKFIESIMEERLNNPVLPFISVGSATYMGYENVDDVKDRADSDMYEHKQRRKMMKID